MKNLTKLNRAELKNIKGGYVAPGGGGTGDPLCYICSCSVSGQVALWVGETRSEAQVSCSYACGVLCEIPYISTCDPTKL